MKDKFTQRIAAMCVVAIVVASALFWLMREELHQASDFIRALAD